LNKWSFDDLAHDEADALGTHEMAALRKQEAIFGGVRITEAAASVFGGR
jgi:hypothetical protein